MTEDMKCAGWIALIVVMLSALIIGMAALKASLKASAYERVTGRKVSTWDAMWLELRVTDGS